MSEPGQPSLRQNAVAPVDDLERTACSLADRQTPLLSGGYPSIDISSSSHLPAQGLPLGANCPPPPPPLRPPPRAHHVEAFESDEMPPQRSSRRARKGSTRRRQDTRTIAPADVDADVEAKEAENARRARETRRKKKSSRRDAVNAFDNDCVDNESDDEIETNREGAKTSVHRPPPPRAAFDSEVKVKPHGIDSRVEPPLARVVERRSDESGEDAEAPTPQLDADEGVGFWGRLAAGAQSALGLVSDLVSAINADTDSDEEKEDAVEKPVAAGNEVDVDSIAAADAKSVSSSAGARRDKETKPSGTKSDERSLSSNPSLQKHVHDNDNSNNGCDDDPYAEYVTQFCLYLGIDAVSEPHLIGEVDAFLKRAIPEGWTAHQTDAFCEYGAGYSYFAHDLTGRTQWTRPDEEEFLSYLAQKIKRPPLAGSRLFFAALRDRTRRARSAELEKKVGHLSEMRPLLRALPHDAVDPASWASPPGRQCIVHVALGDNFPILHPAALEAFANYLGLGGGSGHVGLRDVPQLWIAKLAAVCPVPEGYTFSFDEVSASAVFVDSAANTASRHHPLDAFFAGLLERSIARHRSFEANEAQRTGKPVDLGCGAAFYADAQSKDSPFWLHYDASKSKECVRADKPSLQPEISAASSGPVDVSAGVKAKPTFNLPPLPGSKPRDVKEAERLETVDTGSHDESKLQNSMPISLPIPVAQEPVSNIHAAVAQSAVSDTDQDTLRVTATATDTGSLGSLDVTASSVITATTQSGAPLVSTSPDSTVEKNTVEAASMDEPHALPSLPEFSPPQADVQSATPPPPPPPKPVRTRLPPTRPPPLLQPQRMETHVASPETHQDQDQSDLDSNNLEECLKELENAVGDGREPMILEALASLIEIAPVNQHLLAKTGAGRRVKAVQRQLKTESITHACKQVLHLWKERVLAELGTDQPTSADQGAECSADVQAERETIVSNHAPADGVRQTEGEYSVQSSSLALNGQLKETADDASSPPDAQSETFELSENQATNLPMLPSRDSGDELTHWTQKDGKWMMRGSRLSSDEGSGSEPYRERQSRTTKASAVRSGARVGRGVKATIARLQAASSGVPVEECNGLGSSHAAAEASSHDDAHGGDHEKQLVKLEMLANQLRAASARDDKVAICEVLRALEHVPATVHLLRDTQLGVLTQPFKDDTDQDVRTVARRLRRAWKGLIQAASAQDLHNSTPVDCEAETRPPVARMANAPVHGMAPPGDEEGAFQPSEDVSADVASSSVPCVAAEASQSSIASPRSEVDVTPTQSTSSTTVPHNAAPPAASCNTDERQTLPLRLEKNIPSAAAIAAKRQRAELLMNLQWLCRLYLETREQLYAAHDGRPSESLVCTGLRDEQDVIRFKSLLEASLRGAPGSRPPRALVRTLRAFGRRILHSRQRSSLGEQLHSQFVDACKDTDGREFVATVVPRILRLFTRLIEDDRVGNSHTDSSSSACSADVDLWADSSQEDDEDTGRERMLETHMASLTTEREFSSSAGQGLGPLRASNSGCGVTPLAPLRLSAGETRGENRSGHAGGSSFVSEAPSDVVPVPVRELAKPPFYSREPTLVARLAKTPLPDVEGLAGALVPGADIATEGVLLQFSDEEMVLLAYALEQIEEAASKRLIRELEVRDDLRSVCMHRREYLQLLDGSFADA